MSIAMGEAKPPDVKTDQRQVQALWRLRVFSSSVRRIRSYEKKELGFLDDAIVFDGNIRREVQEDPSRTKKPQAQIPARRTDWKLWTLMPAVAVLCPIRSSDNLFGSAFKH
mgnify:CR=1 FL=1